MGDEGLGLGEFQLEFFLQEGSKMLLDFFCFRSWANKSQEKIIGIADVSQSSVLGVIHVLSRQFLRLISQMFCFSRVSSSSLKLGAIHESCVLRVRFPFDPSGVLWDKNGFYILVQFIKQDV